MVSSPAFNFNNLSFCSLIFCYICFDFVPDFKHMTDHQEICMLIDYCITLFIGWGINLASLEIPGSPLSYCSAK